MRNKGIILLLLAILMAGLFSGIAFYSAHAQTGSGFDLTWNVVSAGGGTGVSSGHGFAIVGTIGQTAISSCQGSGFTIQQGFWNRLLALLENFLPLIRK